MKWANKYLRRRPLSCAHLVADVLREEWGVDIPLPTPHGTEAQRLFKVHFPCATEECINPTDGDIVVFARGRAKHIGIVVMRGGVPYVLHGGGGGQFVTAVESVSRVAQRMRLEGYRRLVRDPAGALKDNGLVAAEPTSIFLVFAAAAAVSVGATLLAGLFSPSVSEFNSESETTASNTYSLSGGSNKIRAYEPLPLIFGRVRVYADYAAMPYVYYDKDGEQHIAAIYNFGYGDLRGVKYQLGDTDITEIQSLVIDNISGTLVADEDRGDLGGSYFIRTRELLGIRGEATGRKLRHSIADRGGR
ncbi:hypothetical protein NQX30_05660 [Candidatus Persebacteraceae bacterium Df01]|jgi:hypothetical protein|uniref:NlpC/P60 domain-containing protein n=1 Tax=Candidatus Doriopsillibacter californiensis TaxID=2970740 RepID=A0ABT7QMA8_9GAMM|nr:hypothetical protein [Candidatus Persebacteraceae bacterium Df01]